MSLARWLNQIATITPRGPGPGPKNEYGRPTEAAGTPFDVRCLVQSTGGVEVLIGRDSVVADFRVFLPAGTAIDASDTFTVSDPRYAGHVFEVMGAPDRADGRKGEHHVEVLCREVTG